MRDKTLFQLNLAIGVIMWGIAIGQSLDTWHTLEQIYLLILFGVGILVPLALYTTRETPLPNGVLSNLPQIALYFQPIVVICTGLAILDKASFGLLGVAWFLQASLMALIGIARWLPNPLTTLEEIVLNMGFIYTATSGIWFLISRTMDSFMGFSGIIIPLTAAHFVFIGMGSAYQCRFIRTAHPPTCASMFALVSHWGRRGGHQPNFGGARNYADRIFG